MRKLGEDASNESVKLQVETDEDLWHLYNIIEVGDLVTASTTRREEKAADKLRAEKMEKKRMTLGKYIFLGILLIYYSKTINYLNLKRIPLKYYLIFLFYTLDILNR